MLYICKAGSAEFNRTHEARLTGDQSIEYFAWRTDEGFLGEVDLGRVMVMTQNNPLKLNDDQGVLWTPGKVRLVKMVSDPTDEDPRRRIVRRIFLDIEMEPEFTCTGIGFLGVHTFKQKTTTPSGNYPPVTEMASMLRIDADIPTPPPTPSMIGKIRVCTILKEEADKKAGKEESFQQQDIHQPIPITAMDPEEKDDDQDTEQLEIPTGSSTPVPESQFNDDQDQNGNEMEDHRVDLQSSPIVPRYQKKRKRSTAVAKKIETAHDSDLEQEDENEERSTLKRRKKPRRSPIVPKKVKAVPEDDQDQEDEDEEIEQRWLPKRRQKPRKSSAVPKNIKAVPEDDRDQEDEDEEVEEQCFYCGDVCPGHNRLKMHVISHYYDVFKPYLPTSAPHTCPLCQYTARDQTSLIRHYAFKHNKIFELTNVTKKQLGYSNRTQKKKPAQKKNLEPKASKKAKEPPGPPVSSRTKKKVASSRPAPAARKQPTEPQPSTSKPTLILLDTTSTSTDSNMSFGSTAEDYDPLADSAAQKEQDDSSGNEEDQEETGLSPPFQIKKEAIDPEEEGDQDENGESGGDTSGGTEQ